TNGLNQIPMNMNPHGTAMNNTIQQLSGAIGSAVLITVMNGRMAIKETELIASNSDYSNESILQLSMLSGVNLAFFASTLLAITALCLAFFMKRVTSNMDSTKNIKKVG